MKSLCFVSAFAVLAIAASARAEIPDSAKTVLTSLQRLDGKVEAGIAYRAYDADVVSLCGDLAVFLASPDAQKDPTLTRLFTNARDCHQKVRAAWNAQLLGDDASERYRAATFMIYAPSFVWKTAAENTSFATKLANAKQGERAAIEKAISDAGETLTIDSAVKKAREFCAAERKKVADDNRLAEEKNLAEEKTRQKEATDHPPAKTAKQLQQEERLAKEAKAKAEAVAAKARRANDKEGLAAGKLRLAKAIMAANAEKAKDRLQEIIDKYPGTAGAKEAAELLKSGF